VAARRAHNPKVVGSSPTPATKTIDKWPLELSKGRSFCILVRARCWFSPVTDHMAELRNSILIQQCLRHCLRCDLSLQRSAAVVKPPPL
jgi:hypothetical protein